MKKNILGLDLGTNSIGWALIEHDFENKQGKILGMGSRIVPMDAGEMGKFAEGSSISKTADRTKYRSARRLRERNLLRRERLLRVLNVLGFLPEHYASEIDFEKHFGKFKEETEPKLVWRKNGKKKNGKDKFEFIFPELFKEMIADFKVAQPELLNGNNKKGKPAKIPYDWTIYYLRKKALSKAITKEQLAWLILNFNQKRGYYQLRGEEEEETPNKLVEFHSLKVIEVKPEIKYTLTLENGEKYYRTCDESIIDWKDTERDFIITRYSDNKGEEKRTYLLKEDASRIKKKKTISKKKKTVEIVEEHSVKIIDVKEDKQEKNWYSLVLENGWIYRRESKEPLLDWKGKVREFIVTTDLNDDGTVKMDDEGNENRSFRAPKEGDWTLVKKKTENDLEKYISEYGKYNEVKGTVGAYIYQILLKNPTQKIRGKLVRTIERKFYKDELKQILQKQIELQPELFTDDLYNACVSELYKSNEAHQIQLSQRDFIHLFLDDIIFYQRPLRSQKSAIGNCTLEYRLHKINVKDKKGNAIKNEFEKDKDGNDIEITEYLKCIPKSNPYYQEFRVWQWLRNLKIYTRKDDYVITNKFITEASIGQDKHEKDLEGLFEFLMTKKEVNHIDILKHFIEPIIKEKYTDAKANKLKEEIAKEINRYRWNYVFDDSKEKEEDKSKNYPMNKTGYEIRERLKKVKDVPSDFLNRATKQQLWHIIYSVTDKKEYETALEKFAKKHSLYYVPKAERNTENPDRECFVYNFKNLVWTEKDYGSYSEKAIKKLLPLMRLGKYWKVDEIIKDSPKYFNNINTLIEKLDTKAKAITEKEKADWNKTINQRLFNELVEFKSGDINSLKGLPLHIAQYLVYGRHSELGSIDIWERSFDIQTYLYHFKQHSLRNPIVEQIITETLRTVKDIWEHYAEKNQIPFEIVYDEHKKKKVKSYPKFFDEIHIEMGREMKNTADDRKEMTRQISENENTNLRIKTMLMEFANDNAFKNQVDYRDEKGDIPDFYKKGNNPVRPYSPKQQDILKIFEEGVLQTYTDQQLKDIKTGEYRKDKEGKQKEVSIYDIATTAQPSKNEITRYKLWLEQKYKSPYTGEIIPLSKLFTTAYEIEHIIPKSRYFDNSLGNKVICEAEVNSLKDNQLGLEFIKNSFGQKITTIGSGEVAILTEDAYRKFVDEHYAKNKAKRNKLLLEDIPDKMITRQMNDTRYISKFVSNLLSNMVRTDKSDDGVNSKNLISCNGKITDRLKQDWGLNNVWNELILSRFERMNELNECKRNELVKELEEAKLEYKHNLDTFEEDKKNIIENCDMNEDEKRKQLALLDRKLSSFKDKIFNIENEISLTIFTTKNKEGHVIPSIPVQLSKGFQKKRIDHRHHAMDALVIACATRDHVNLLNNQFAKTDNTRKDLQNKLRNKEKWIDDKGNERIKFTEFKLPWEHFANNAKDNLENIVVSFKQNLRVINKATNFYKKIVNGKKVTEEQKGVNWAIRKPMHEETVSGLVKLPWVKLGKGEITTATRERNDLVSIFKDIKTKDKAENKINKITDTGIQEILLNYLKSKDNNPELAFSPEGIEYLNQNISRYNNGKFHQPIFKVRTYEKGKGRFILGVKGNKRSKYVQGAPNLFFAIYQDENGKRIFETIPLNIVIERQKQGLYSLLEINKDGYNLLFHLSPNDLVYVPTEEELKNSSTIDFENLTNEQKKRLYNVNDFSSACYFSPNSLAKAIAPKEVDLSFDKEKNKLSGSFDIKTASLDGEQIKDICIKLKVDRLGNISKPNN